MSEIHVHVHVNVERPLTEAEQFIRGSNALAAAYARMWQRHIEVEQAKGNVHFANVQTQEDYQRACQLTERDRRRELGFWKYHFGS